MPRHDAAATIVTFPEHMTDRDRPKEARVWYADEGVIALDEDASYLVGQLRGTADDHVDTTDWFTGRNITIRATDCGSPSCRCAITYEVIQ